MKNRMIGMLLGLHVGDSLGANLEFTASNDEENLQTEIVGGGNFNWRPGEATDDTQMMLCLLKSLSEKGEVDLNDISSKYLSWYLSNPKDIGGTVRRALSNLEIGYSYDESGLKDFFSQGNGSLMRCAPLALIPTTKSEIIGQCSITHAHKNCLDCDIIYVEALKDCLRGLNKEQIFSNAKSVSKEINNEIYVLLEKVPSMSWSEIYTEGFVIETLAFSFWSLLYYDNFEDSLIRVVNRGGDADTLGAVTGSLCGAYYGLESIPLKWLSKIENRELILNECSNLFNKRKLLGE